MNFNKRILKKMGKLKNYFFIPVILSVFFLIAEDALCFDFGGAFKSIDINRIVDVGKSVGKAFSDINEEEQYYIGRSVGAHILAKYNLSDNSDLWNYVSKIGQNLALASERPDTFKGYHFILLDEPDRLNAFSMPSGFIFITTGLISKASNEDELAGVLAHEVAHIVLHHPSDSIKKVYKDRIKKDLLSFASDKISAGQTDQLVKGLVNGLNQISGMLVDSAAKGYSRGKEKDSDLMAVSIMKTAGYDPTSLAEVLKKLNPVGSGKSGTHGKPLKRSKNIVRFIKKSGDHPSLMESRTKRFVEIHASAN